MDVCDYVFKWSSSELMPSHKRLYEVNVLLSVGLTFSSIQHSKWLRFCKFSRIIMQSNRCLTNHVKKYGNPTVRFLYEKQHNIIIERLRARSQPSVLIGDMQYGSIGELLRLNKNAF